MGNSLVTILSMFLPIPAEKRQKKKTALKLYKLVILSLCNRVSNQTKGYEWEEVRASAKLHKEICCYAATMTSSYCPDWVFSNQTSANLHNSCNFWNLVPERPILLLEGSVSSPGGRRCSCGAEQLMGFLIRTGRRWQVRSRRLWRYWVFHKVALLSPDCVSILDSVTLSSAQI